MGRKRLPPSGDPAVEAYREKQRNQASAWAKDNRKRYNERMRQYRKDNLLHLQKYERDRRRAERLANPDRVYARNRTKSLRKYGLTIEAWEILFDSQGRACAICRNIDSGDGRWHTDHDEDLGYKAVRGILCVRCNIGLGLFLHRPDLLELAIHYITSAKERLCPKSAT